MAARLPWNFWISPPWPRRVASLIWKWRGCSAPPRARRRCLLAVRLAVLPLQCCQLLALPRLQIRLRLRFQQDQLAQCHLFCLVLLEPLLHQFQYPFGRPLSARPQGRLPITGRFQFRRPFRQPLAPVLAGHRRVPFRTHLCSPE